MSEQIVMEELGESGITEIIAAFYRRAKVDDVIGPMYPDQDWEGSEQRLRDFIIYRMGGSQKYIEERGHPRLKMRHAPFKIGIPERDRWLKLMGEAMVEAEAPETSRKWLGEFFEQIADFMRNQPE